jgi:hypothetical protein
MAYPVNKIEQITAIATDPVGYTPHGSNVYTFDSFLVGPPQNRPVEELRVVSREGVDGVMLVATGKRGKPFPLVTRRYVNPATVDPFTVLGNYQSLIGIDFGVAVTQRDLLYWPCDVLSVDFAIDQPALRRWTKAPVSGYLSPSLELLCLWQLIPRDAT